MEPLGQVATNLTVSKQHLTTSSAASSKATSLALYHSKLILGCYRTDSVSDPQVYITAIATVLSRYPTDIGIRLSDPQTGIAGKLQWLPSVAEIRQACDEMQASDVATAKRCVDLVEQFRLRDEAEGKSESPEFREAVIERCKAEMRAKGIQFKGDQPRKHTKTWKPFSNVELESIYGSASAKGE